MSGFFRRLYLRAACRGICALRIGIFFAVVCAYFMVLSQARAREEHLSRIDQADQAILIREHAGWNKDCEAIAHPALYLFSPPRHGKVCARAERIKIKSMYAGTESQCIGHSVSGVQLIYRPDETFSGDDVILYAAQYPSVLRTISIKVTVKASPPRTSAVAQSEFSVPNLIQQLPGLVPDCPQYMF